MDRGREGRMQRPEGAEAANKRDEVSSRYLNIQYEYLRVSTFTIYGPIIFTYERANNVRIIGKVIR